MHPRLDPSHAIAMAYAAALDRERWREVLAALVDVSGATGAQLLSGKRIKGESLVSIGIDPAEDARYNQYYGAIDPLPQMLGTLEAGGILSCREAIARDDTRHSPFFIEWADPNHVSDAVFLRLSSSSDPLCALALGHPYRDTPFLRPALRAYLAVVGPHLVNAFDISRRLERASLEGQACQACFDQLGRGWMLVSATCHLRDINQTGRLILDEEDGLRLRQGMIEAIDPAINAHLLKSVAAGTGMRFAAADFGRPFEISRASGASPYMVSMMPHQTPDGWFNQGCDHVAILITDPAREEQHLMHALRNDYGLTIAEAQVALRVRGSRGLRQVALERGVSLSTTRIHLQRVFEKTATHRQSELIMLMSSLSAPPRTGNL